MRSATDGRRVGFASAMAAVLLAGCVTKSTVVHHITPPRADVISVLDVGAKGDGETDDTAAFQQAMDLLGEDGRGGTVVVPRGIYLIGGHLSIPANVTLEGIWAIPTAWTERKGSTLLAVEGEGDPDATPFITLNANSVVKGLTIFYPNQVADNPPKAYPWCIAGNGGDNASIIDVLLVNPYQGVDFGTKPSGRHFIRNLYGYPLYKGLFVDQCYDIGRVENVHFWPFWNAGDQARQQKIQEFVAQNGTSFLFARTDWEYVTNTFSWGYKIGYHFLRSKSGYANGNFLGIGADACEVSVQVDECAPYGLLITNGEFVAFNGPDPVALQVDDANFGVVQMQNCAFWGGPSKIASIHGVGTVMFNNCNFESWDGKEKGNPAIEVLGGALVLNSCNFTRPGKQVYLGPKVTGATITGNRFTGPIAIVNESEADVQIGLNSAGQRPREEANAIVIDDSDGAPRFRIEGEWHLGAGGGDYLGIVRWTRHGDGTCKAFWQPTLPAAGRYKVFVYYGDDPVKDHATDATFVVRHAAGEAKATVNFREGCRKWNLLGEFDFPQGDGSSVMLSNAANGHVVADAVKFVPVP